MRSGAILMAAAFSLWTNGATAQEIEIKGLRIGMPKSQVEEKFGPLPLKGFTIAGVPNKYKIVPIAFYEDALDGLDFFFDSGSFDIVMEAVKSKFPEIKCADSAVGNAMGASFKQVDCRLQDATGKLVLTRYVGDVQTSALTLTSTRRMKEFAEKRNSMKNDL